MFTRGDWMKQSDAGKSSIGLLRIWLSGFLLESTGFKMQVNRNFGINSFTYRIYRTYDKAYYLFHKLHSLPIPMNNLIINNYCTIKEGKDYKPQSSASADNTYRDLDYSGYHRNRI